MFSDIYPGDRTAASRSLAPSGSDARDILKKASELNHLLATLFKRPDPQIPSSGLKMPVSRRNVSTMTDISPTVPNSLFRSDTRMIEKENTDPVSMSVC